jgi:hypothetical protein
MKSMKNILCSLVAVIAILLPASRVLAQTDFTLYHMKMVPYRIYQNPAMVPQTRIFVGLPLNSSTYINSSNSFSYNNIITREADDSLKIDIDKLMIKLDDRNNMIMNFDIDLLSFGMRVAESYYINFSARERALVRFSYPKDLINFVWKGNAAIGLDKELDFSPRFDAMIYDEFAIGVAKEVDEKLTLGLRVKLLNGHANIYTERAKVSFYTDPNDFSYLLKSDILIRTAGIDRPDDQKTREIFRGGNLGFGIDLGATYKLNDKFSFSASLLDLGTINWKKKLLTLKSNRPGEAVNFAGVGVGDFFNQNSSLEDAFKVVIDSLKDQFKIDSLYNQSYKTVLPIRFYAGADFNINDKNSIGMTFHGQFYDKKLLPSFSLSYYNQISRKLGMSASYNITNNSYNNVGFGISLNMGVVQLYATTDNVFALPNIKRTQNVNIHGGLVFIFGNERKDKGKVEPIETENE